MLPASMSSIRLLPRLTLRREVDDVPWIRQRRQFMDEHAARLDFTAFARRGVSLEILRKKIPELESDPAADHTNAIDTVYQRLDILPENIAVPSSIMPPSLG